jgi:FixJ family two-component response regulator
VIPLWGSEGKARGAVGFVQKPFKVSSLMTIIRKLFDDEAMTPGTPNP